MFENQLVRICLWSVLTAVLLTACAPNQAPTPTAVILADCFQSATALAWLDKNGNEVRDAGEPPLPGIEFMLEPTVYSRASSGAEGIAHIFATTPGGSCQESLLVTAVSYDGYELTTPAQLDYISPDEQYAFGFRPVSEPETQAILIEAAAYEGIIFTAETTAENLAWLDEPAEAAWMPTVADVAALEDGLVAFLQTDDSLALQNNPPLWQRLVEYKRQYFGLEQNGQRLIYASFFCDALGTAWQETPVIVADGGDCYFQVMYNPQSKTFEALRINGES